MMSSLDNLPGHENVLGSRILNSNIVVSSRVELPYQNITNLLYINTTLSGILRESS